jgi:ABC-type Co2+ transport system permease subunit
MKPLPVGLLFAAAAATLAAWWWGRSGALAAGAAGLLATGVETVAVSALRPALEPPFERLLKRWAVGLALRLAGVAGVGIAVLRWPERFPVLPTALGFLMVLLPLLFGEMRLVVTKLRTTR